MADESILDKLDAFMAANDIPLTSSTFSAGGGSMDIYYGSNILSGEIITKAFEMLDGVEEAEKGIDDAAEAPQGGTRLDSAMGKAYKGALKDYAKGKIDENPGATLDVYIAKQKEKLKERPTAMARLVYSLVFQIMSYHNERGISSVVHDG